MIVVDASVVLELLLQTAAAERIATIVLDRRETLHAPHLLDVEVAQVLRRYTSRGDLSASHGQSLLDVLAAFPVARYPHQPLVPRMWELRHNMTAYDASYVALAEGLRAMLVTRDDRLAAAPGHRARIEVL